ncbi:MAG TPA: dihydrofolate reductase [Actinotalea sp.]|nr:dihydrofolate reductase [Actinotalea sp.]
MDLGLIWAQSSDRVIGVGGGLPWHLPEDLAHFRAITDGAVVIMGRATWESLPDRFRPLPGRVNLVLSRRPGLLLAGATVVGDPQQALAVAGRADRPAWVIGGGKVYSAFVDRAARAEVTEVDLVVGGGVAAPSLGTGWVPGSKDPDEGWHTSGTGVRYRFRGLRRDPAGSASAGRSAPGEPDRPE